METFDLSSRNSYVRSLARGLSVIRSFTADSPVKTVSQVATATGLDRAGARRMLRTLVALGYVEHQGLTFQLTPRILNLAHVYLSTTAVWGSVEPVLQNLAKEVSEACSATILDGTEIVHVVDVPGPRLMTAHVPVGTRLPAYCTSTGRILLGALSKHELDRVLTASNITKHTRYSVTSIAELKRIIRRDHEHGWSFLNQELEEGLRALAVPIFDRSHRIIAAITVVGDVSRSSPKAMISRALPRLKRAAKEISDLLPSRGSLLGKQSLDGSDTKGSPGRAASRAIQK